MYVISRSALPRLQPATSKSRVRVARVIGLQQITDVRLVNRILVPTLLLDKCDETDP